MNTDTIPTATIHNLFRFHGLLLPVVLHQSEEYIPVKPVVDLLGIDWRNIKKSLSGGYKQVFFGFCTLKVPLPHGLGGDITPQIPCIYLAKMHFWLAQVNPEKVQAQGNQDSARLIRELHEEWAQALHDYETSGIAVKKDHLHTLKELMRLRKLASGAEAERLTILIAREMGTPLPTENHPQQPLFV